MYMYAKKKYSEVNKSYYYTRVHNPVLNKAE